MKRTKQIIVTISSLIILTFFVGTAQAQVWIGDYWINSSYDIDALSGYDEVTGNLFIVDSDLTSFSGLENLTSVGGDLVVDSNPFLTNLDGLRHISSLGGNLIIWENTSLASLNGFLSHHITSLNGDLIIGENDSLTSLNGLENITRVGYRVDIFSNETLTSLSGLGNLTSVDGGLDIKGNSSLTSLTGLENLIGVGGDLVILNNEALINLCALYNVNLGANSLSIGYNNALSMDTVFALRNQLIINGFTGLTATGGNNGSVQVFCDNDSDTVYDDTDNCPNVANPLQEDVDEDGVGNLCDANTVYGNISWAIQEGITVNIYILSCGAPQPYASVTTNAQGYYAIGNIENGRYLVVLDYAGYRVTPNGRWGNIPQAEIQSCNFKSPRHSFP
jgi:hypothetical protein